MTTRKRRRQEAFEEQTEEEAAPAQTEEEAANAREEKELEIWDAVREAHYEAIEQLPLTLQRQLSLVKQLDDQASGCTTLILPTLQKYIELRRRLAGKSHTNDSQHPPEAIGANTSCPTTSPSVKVKLESRDMAQQIALLSEELLRASQEKVNIAQANCDTVERHIHLIDQAIKEQEAALSSDPDNPVRMHLPELVIPQWRPKPAQSTMTVDANVGQQSEDPNSVDVVGDHHTVKRASKKKGKRRKQEESPSLTITLPATHPSDEPELLYCYCNRASFGEMVACDNTNCEREWFHYGCVGLLEPPEGEWFCEDCRLRQEDL